MDTYQAIYDAVRSKLSGGNIDEAVRSAIRSVDIGHDVAMVAGTAESSMAEIVQEQVRPSVLFKPSLTVDGNQWCALYGKSLQEGVAGFGNSPEEAVRDFDKNWCDNLPSNINARR